MKSVRFVIPSFRSRATIGRTLRSIRGLHSQAVREVVVVDSGNDGTAEWIRGEYPEVKVLALKHRVSAAAARNRGAETTRCRFLAFVDSDAELHPDWLQVLEAELEKSPARLVGGFVANANPESQASRVLHWIEFSQFLPGASRFVDALSSSNLLIRRDDFEAIGGFNPDWEMAEDLLFCRQLGSGIRFCGGVGIQHLHRVHWEAVMSHLQQLGYWSGRLRAQGLGRGAWLRQIPSSATLLVPWRAVQIARRVVQSNPHQSGQLIRDFPALMSGLRRWLSGFRQGLQTQSGAVPARNDPA